jgi:dephospho-CoA kinase
VVYEAIGRWYHTLDRPMGVASIPLLYETHRERDFDFVAVTVCAPEQQLQRLRERDGISEEEARQRIAAQMPAEQKAALGNFVILTGGTPLATDRQVDELLIAIHNFRT